MSNYKLSDFDFYLPEELIAQEPKDARDTSRLLVLHKNNGQIEHDIFRNLDKHLDENFVIVRNNTKVVPARLFGQKTTGASVEFLLNKRIKKNTEKKTDKFKNSLLYEVAARPMRRLKVGDRVIFKKDILEAEVVERKEDVLIVEFQFNGVFEEVLNELGKVPLPKYIKKELKNLDKYQTIYAKEGESAAAPTAGLHFTEELFDKLKSKSIEILDINLNVGLGTFAPVRDENIEKHKMHSETFKIEKEVADKINDYKKMGKKILAIGTTTTRALESAFSEEENKLQYGEFETNIFIKPGYKFKVVDALITNFHLPKSTLIMLVSAFAGLENIKRAYKEAVKEKYKFFSFGDAMLII